MSEHLKPYEPRPQRPTLGELSDLEAANRLEPQRVRLARWDEHDYHEAANRAERLGYGAAADYLRLIGDDIRRRRSLSCQAGRPAL